MNIYFKKTWLIFLCLWIILFFKFIFPIPDGYVSQGDGLYYFNPEPEQTIIFQNGDKLFLPNSNKTYKLNRIDFIKENLENLFYKIDPFLEFMPFKTIIIVVTFLYVMMLIPAWPLGYYMCHLHKQ
ncbi:hypothetical protein ACFL1Y_00245 [Patescibacteria group bacterium]